MTDDTIYLKDWRLFADLTQEQLGKMLGVTGAQVSRIETGTRDYDGRYLRAFKAAINKALDAHPSASKPRHIRLTHHGEALTIQPSPNQWRYPRGQQQYDDLVADIKRAVLDGLESGEIPATQDRKTA